MKGKKQIIIHIHDHTGEPFGQVDLDNIKDAAEDFFSDYHIDVLSVEVKDEEDPKTKSISIEDVIDET